MCFSGLKDMLWTLLCPSVRIECIDDLSLCIGLVGFVMTWAVEILLAWVTAASVDGGCDKSTVFKVEQTSLRV